MWNRNCSNLKKITSHCFTLISFWNILLHVVSLSDFDLASVHTSHPAVFASKAAADFNENEPDEDDDKIELDDACAIWGDAPFSKL